MGHAILDVINQVEAMRKFVSEYFLDICVAIIMEFKSKELLENVLIGAGFIRWTNSLPLYYQ
jgi:hypothetical protein